MESVLCDVIIIRIQKKDEGEVGQETHKKEMELNVLH